MAGARSPQVTRRLTAALIDLLSVAPPDSSVLREQLELLEAATTAAIQDARDLEMALTPDERGIGAAASRAMPEQSA